MSEKKHKLFETFCKEREIPSDLIPTFNEYCNNYLKGNLELTYEKMIYEYFPDIKNLVVSIDSERQINIKFDSGVYTKEEVLGKIYQVIQDLKFVNDNNPNGK